MSLNQITDYDNKTRLGLIEGRVNNMFITDNLNIAMGGAVPGDELLIDVLGEITWFPGNDTRTNALEHFQTSFPNILLTQTEYTEMALNAADIPDITGGIAIEGNAIRILNTTQAIFLCFVKYVVDVQSEASCYEFRVEKSVSPTIGPKIWTPYSRYGNCTTTVLNNPLYGNQSFQLMFPLDTLNAGLVNNTYIRFAYRKNEPTSPNAAFLGLESNIVVLRVV